jgi:acid phosphatase
MESNALGYPACIGNRWPHFTASITFELFKGTPTAPKGVFQKFFGPSDPAPHCASLFISFNFPPVNRANTYLYTDVRMRYGNRSLKLPLCAAPGRHLPGSPEFCTLEAFSKRAIELAPMDWESECQATSKAKLKTTKAADAVVATQQIVLAKVVKEI